MEGEILFSSSFESVSAFDGFYITPQDYLNSTSHEQSLEQVYSGTYSHKAWIYNANEALPFVNTNHRGYPTIKLNNAGKHVKVEFMVSYSI